MWHWQRIVKELEEIKRDLFGASVVQQRRSSRSSDELAVPLDDNGPRQTQEEANAAFVREYGTYLEAHYGRPYDGHLGDLYCCMVPLHGCWWMALGHPVVAVLRNSDIGVVAQASQGQLVAFTNQDVEAAMLEIAAWFAKVKQEPE